MRLVRIAVLGLVTMGALHNAVAMLPPSVAYTLSDTCGWSPRPWARAVGADKAPLRTDPQAMWECRHRRGLKSRNLEIDVLLQRWPSPEQLAAWNDGEP